MTYPIAKLRIEDLTNEQLSWMIAKHVTPNDTAVQDPAMAVGGYYYDYAEPEPECETCRLMDKYKISTIWRPFMGEAGQWWACAEVDGGDEDAVGRFGDTRTQAAMRALLAHLEAVQSGQCECEFVDVPEVLL